MQIIDRLVLVIIGNINDVELYSFRKRITNLMSEISITWHSNLKEDDRRRPV